MEGCDDPMERRPLSTVILTLAAVAAAAQTAGDGVKLEWRFRKGDAFRYRVTQDAAQDVTGSPKPVHAEARVQLVLRFDVLEVEGGAAWIRARYEAARVRMTTGAGTKMEFDSSRAAGGAPLNDVYSVMLASAIGQEFHFRSGADGRVRDVAGGDATVDRMVSILGNHPAKKGVREALVESFGDRALARTFEILFAVVPSSPVKIGESWTDAVDWPVPELGNVRFDRRFTLRRLETVGGEGRARADVRLTPALIVDLTSPTSQAYEVETKEASGAGELDFGFGAGRAVRVAASQRLVTRWKPRLPESLPESAPSRPTLEQTMKTVTTLELLTPGEGLDSSK